MFVWESVARPQQFLHCLDVLGKAEGPGQGHRDSWAGREQPVVIVRGTRFHILPTGTRRGRALHRIINGRVRQTPSGCRITAKLQIPRTTVALLWGLVFGALGALPYATIVSTLPISERLPVVPMLLGMLICYSFGALVARGGRGAKYPRGHTEERMLELITQAVQGVARQNPAAQYGA